MIFPWEHAAASFTRSVLRSGGLVYVLLALIALSCHAGPAPATDIRIGVEGAYPPFSEVAPDGELTGFDIDIAHSLCAQMRVSCILIQQNFDGMIPALNANKIDAVIASLSITDERRQAVDFTDKYYKTPGRLVGRADASLEPTPDGLNGRRIGVQRASSYDRFATDVFVNSDVVRYTKQDDAFLDLSSGRIDAVLCDSVAAYVGFLRQPSGAGYAFIGPPFVDPRYFGYGAGIAVRKGDVPLREAFNAAIAAIRADGTYARIQKKYVDFDLYVETTPAVAERQTLLRGYAASLLRGAMLTLAMALGSLAVALLFGIAGSSAKLSRSRWLQSIAHVYTSAVRAVPDLVLLLLVFFGGQAMVNSIAMHLGLAQRIDINPFVAGLVSLGLVFGAYLTETFRGAYLSVPPGQREAALAFAMTRRQTFQRIVGPQMLRHALAPLLNNWLVLLKSTAIVSVIGLTDLMQRTGLAAGATREPFLFYAAAGAIYLVFTALSEILFAWISRRLSIGTGGDIY